MANDEGALQTINPEPKRSLVEVRDTVLIPTLEGTKLESRKEEFPEELDLEEELHLIAEQASEPVKP